MPLQLRDYPKSLIIVAVETIAVAYYTQRSKSQDTTWLIGAESLLDMETYVAQNLPEEEACLTFIEMDFESARLISKALQVDGVCWVGPTGRAEGVCYVK